MPALSRSTLTNTVSPRLELEAVGRQDRAARANDGRDGDLAGHVELREDLAVEPGRDLDLHQLDLGVAVLVLAVQVGVRDHVEQAGARPRHRGDRRDAQAAVDLGAAGVVDARDDARDAEVLLGGAGGDDVAVVAARDGGEAVRVADAGILEHVAVEDGADELLAHDLVALFAVEDERVVVDDRDRVALELEHPREIAADPPVPADDYVQSVHRASPHLRVGLARVYRAQEELPYLIGHEEHRCEHREKRPFLPASARPCRTPPAAAAGTRAPPARAASRECPTAAACS